MSKSLVSIVVPVYQAEYYLKETLDSILNQTYSYYELLLVDDGSTDRSGMICDQCAKADSRIKVFHNPNRGASAARNFGIQHASGEFLVFVDADDLLEPLFLERMISAFELEGIDLALCGFDRFYHDTLSERTDYLLGNKEREILSSNKELCLLFTAPRTNLSGISVWAKMYRTALIKDNHVSFPEHISYEEDCCFNVQYYRHVRKAVTFKESMYHYRQQIESLSKIYKSSTYPNLVNGYKERLALAKELGMTEASTKRITSIFLIVIFNNYKKIISSPMSRRERIAEYRKILDFEETKFVLNTCGLSKVRLTRYLTIVSRKQWVWAIDLLLLLWKKREGTANG